MQLLIELEQFLGKMVSRHEHLVARFSGKVCPDTHDAVSNLAIRRLVVRFQVLPNALTELLFVRTVAQHAEDRADDHHHGKIVGHVLAQLQTRHVFFEIIARVILSCWSMRPIITDSLTLWSSRPIK